MVDALTSNGVIESLLGQLAGLVGRVEDLVVEDGEVQCEAEADGVGGSKVLGSNVSGGLVRLEGLVGGCLALVANGELGEVAVVITLPVERNAVSNMTCATLPGKLTSCGRRPLTRHSRQRESGGRPGTLGYPRRSWPARPRSSGGTP